MSGSRAETALEDAVRSSPWRALSRPPPDPQSQHAENVARLAFGVLAYVIAIVAVATLAPFDFDLKANRPLNLAFIPRDVFQNFFLFFPAGFVCRLALRSERDRLCVGALTMGLGVSLLVESAQFALPGRCPSPIDVCFNGLGAWAGAHMQQRFRYATVRRGFRDLAFELPLATTLYLVVPLLLIDTQALLSPQRWWVTAGLSPFAAVLAASLYQNRFAQATGASRAGYAAVVSLGFAIGVAPGALQEPRAGLGCALLCGALTWLLATNSQPTGEARRFEIPTVRRALPCFLGYLVLLGSYPWSETRLEGVRGNVLALIRIEGIAAFTLLGYMLGQLHARSPLPREAIAARVLGWSCLASLAFSSLHQEGYGWSSSWLNAAGLVLAAAAGAGIQQAQVRVARGLLDARRASLPGTEERSS